MFYTFTSQVAPAVQEAFSGPMSAVFEADQSRHSQKPIVGKSYNVPRKEWDVDFGQNYGREEVEYVPFAIASPKSVLSASREIALGN